MERHRPVLYGAVRIVLTVPLMATSPRNEERKRHSEPLLPSQMGLRPRPGHAATVDGDTLSFSDTSEPGEDHEARKFGFFQKGRDFESYDTNHIWTKAEKVSEKSNTVVAPLIHCQCPLPFG